MEWDEVKRTDRSLDKRWRACKTKTNDLFRSGKKIEDQIYEIAFRMRTKHDSGSSWVIQAESIIKQKDPEIDEVSKEGEVCLEKNRSFLKMIKNLISSLPSEEENKSDIKKALARKDAIIESQEKLARQDREKKESLKKLKARRKGEALTDEQRAFFKIGYESDKPVQDEFSTIDAYVTERYEINKLVRRLYDKKRSLAHRVEDIQDRLDQISQLSSRWSQIRDLLGDFAVAVEPWKCTARIHDFINRPIPSLGSEDKKLALLWCSDDDHRDKAFMREKMFSARRAERAAIDLYALIEGHATDLSMMQLNHSADDRWQEADILAGGRMIDVKNARKSFGSHRSYSEHCVPKFKQRRDTGQDVIVSGFLSPYDSSIETTGSTLSRPIVNRGEHIHGDSLIWLGETSRSQIDKLRSEFDCSYLSVGIDIGQLVPGWLFDYPQKLYQQRDVALANLERCVGSITSNISLLGKNDANLGIETALMNQRFSSSKPPSRPRLFLHVLDRFCSSKAKGDSFNAQELCRIIFPHKRWLGEETPLATYDPLCMVYELIEVLKKIDDYCSKVRLDFTNFKLRGPGILQGWNGRWVTIIAYCGGWGKLRKDKKIRCGKNPIYLGYDENCVACGRLICHRCGYCSSTCTKVKERQARAPFIRS